MNVAYLPSGVLNRALVESWGHRPLEVSTGEDLIAAAVQGDGPVLAVLPEQLPDMPAAELCLRVRQEAPHTYVMVLAGRGGRRSVVAALDAGADDCLPAPPHGEELRARLAAGARLLERLGPPLDAMLVCSYCRRVLDHEAGWTQLEGFLNQRLSLEFSHGICPSCWEEVIRPQLETPAPE